MNVIDLARPEIVAMKPYSSARKEAAAQGVLLNANESPRALLDGSPGGLPLNRYPEPQPAELITGLANLYALPQDSILLTRGSDEGIDLLTRVFCRAGIDAILHCPPTFGMYRVAAQTQGAAIVPVPRLARHGFVLDTQKILDTVQQDPRIRLVFLTSPNNPTGDCVDEVFLHALLRVTDRRAMVVVDEAYIEFCQRESAAKLIAQFPQLVVLRTLSKAWASAGLRCGAVLAQAPVIDLLRRIIAPYPLASPVTAMALQVLQAGIQAEHQELLREIRENKQVLLAMLQGRNFIRDIWPGEANFVLLRVTDAPGLLAHCSRHGVVLRGYAADPDLVDCIRISVGSRQDLAALRQALDDWKGD